MFPGFNLQKLTSGTPSNHRLHYFLYLYFCLSEVCFFFFVLAGNESARAEVTAGLPDWLEFFRGKEKAKWFWGFEIVQNTRWYQVAAEKAHIDDLVYWTKHKVCWCKLCWGRHFLERHQGHFAGVGAGAFESTDQCILVLSLGTHTHTHTLYLEFEHLSINTADSLFLSVAEEQE